MLTRCCCGSLSPKAAATLLTRCISHRLCCAAFCCAALWLQGVHSVAYSPLGHVKDSDVMGHPAVAEVAAETGKTPAQVRESGGTTFCTSAGCGGAGGFGGCLALQLVRVWLQDFYPDPAPPAAHPTPPHPTPYARRSC